MLKYLCRLARSDPFKPMRINEIVSMENSKPDLHIKEKGKNKGKGKMISEIPFVAQENIVEVVIDDEQLLS